MPTRKQIISEKIEEVIRATVPASQKARFDKLTKDLKRADRQEIIDDLISLPKEKRRKFVANLKKSGRL
jgi:putative ubiquitin-RnfH superfamily antitoxin RatB of RatAB toxin-antitoxin module